MRAITAMGRSYSDIDTVGKAEYRKVGLALTPF
jgi:hypothetical protein